MSTMICVDLILISRGRLHFIAYWLFCSWVFLDIVYALYWDHRTIRWIASISYILEIIVMCASLGLAIPGIRYDSNCLVTSVPGTLLVYA